MLGKRQRFVSHMNCVEFLSCRIHGSSANVLLLIIRW